MPIRPGTLTRCRVFFCLKPSSPRRRTNSPVPKCFKNKLGRAARGLGWRFAPILRPPARGCNRHGHALRTEARSRGRFSGRPETRQGHVTHIAPERRCLRHKGYGVLLCSGEGAGAGARKQCHAEREPAGDCSDHRLASRTPTGSRRPGASMMTAEGTGAASAAGFSND